MNKQEEIKNSIFRIEMELYRRKIEGIYNDIFPKKWGNPH